MPGTTHHRTAESRLSRSWTFWVPAGLILLLYAMCVVLHWTGKVDHIPSGLSTLAHIVVIILFVGGCVALVLERMNEMLGPRPVPVRHGKRVLAESAPMPRTADPVFIADVAAEAFQIGIEIEKRRHPE